MSSKPEIGKNIYNEALRRGRMKARAGRDALRRIVEDEPGPQTTAMLVTRVALALGEIEAVFTELDEIGRQAKSLKR